MGSGHIITEWQPSRGLADRSGAQGRGRGVVNTGHCIDLPGHFGCHVCFVTCHCSHGNAIETTHRSSFLSSFCIANLYIKGLHFFFFYTIGSNYFGIHICGLVIHISYYYISCIQYNIHL